MDNQQHESPSTDDDLEMQRASISQMLGSFADDIGIAMRAAHLNFPLGLTVPGSGFALMTMVTPDDPSADDWEQASAIVRRIVSERLGGIALRSRHLPCAMVQTRMSATDIVPNMFDFGTRS